MGLRMRLRRPQQNMCMFMGKPDVAEQQSAQGLLAKGSEHR